MLDNFSFFVLFGSVVAVLYAVGFLLYKAGLLKQALITLIAVLLLGSVAIATGHAETTATTIRTAVVVGTDNNILVLLDGAGLYWLWEDVEDFEVFDVVSFMLIDTRGTSSIRDDEMTQPIYSGIRVDKTWVVNKLIEVKSFESAKN